MDTPPQGWYNINTDAAIFGDSGCIGIGSVIRNVAGEFVRARNQKITEKLQSREAEVVGLREALSWTKDIGIKRCIFETDSKTLADTCKRMDGNAYFHTIVRDCNLFMHFDEVQVEFIHRFANEVAHVLTRATHSMLGIQEWIESASGFISDVLIVDSI